MLWLLLDVDEFEALNTHSIAHWLILAVIRIRRAQNPSQHVIGRTELTSGACSGSIPFFRGFHASTGNFSTVQGLGR